MVLMQGTKRILEKSNPESSSSSTTRTVSIYGITSYSDIIDMIIPIKSAATGIAGIVTININNLGVKNIKSLASGSKVDPSQGWVNAGQTYYITYDGTDFLLIGNNSTGGSNTSNTYVIPYTILSLTSSSTTQQIQNAFVDSNHTSQDFVANITSAEKELIIRGLSLKSIYANYHLNYTSSTLTGIVVEFINNGIYTKQTYTVASGDLTAVTVETSDLLLRNANNTQY